MQEWRLPKSTGERSHWIFAQGNSPIKFLSAKDQYEWLPVGWSLLQPAIHPPHGKAKICKTSQHRMWSKPAQELWKPKDLGSSLKNMDKSSNQWNLERDLISKILIVSQETSSAVSTSPIRVRTCLSSLPTSFRMHTGRRWVEMLRYQCMSTDRQSTKQRGDVQLEDGGILQWHKVNIKNSSTKTCSTW